MKYKHLFLSVGILICGSSAFAQFSQRDLQPQDAAVINELMGNFGIGTFQGTHVVSGTIECTNQREDTQDLIETCAIQPIIRFSRTDRNTAPVFLQPGSAYRTRIIQLLRQLNAVTPTSHGGSIFQAGIFCEDSRGEGGSLFCQITVGSK